jgi:CubicO group peptidase (beta-lactamase class C family)
LHETDPDMPIAKGAPFAQGHSTKLLLGERVLIPGDYSTNAIAPAAGFVATARDLARFFGQLSPGSKRSVLSVVSRREMTRRNGETRSPARRNTTASASSAGRSAAGTGLAMAGRCMATSRAQALCRSKI